MSPLGPAMARALCAFGTADLTPEITGKAKLCLIDYLSSALAARELPWSRQAVALARIGSGTGAAGTAGVVGTALRVSSHDAAFANGVLGHALVRDDMHLGSVSHLGVVVLPALLALLPRHGVNGRTLLNAIAAGYEAGGKLGRAIIDVNVARIFRPTGITGAFAGAAAGAKLAGLDACTTGHALALAANTASGYNEWAATGGSEMFFHPGFAARNAVTAVELAAAGARASDTALDGAAGLLAAFGKRADPATALPFSDRPEILSVFFKPVPACNFAQTAALAAREIALRDRPEADTIARVVVRVPYAAAHYPGCDSTGPFDEILQAKMSIQYNVAAALAAGDFAEARYDAPAQPAIVRLAARVSLEVDAALTQAFPSRQGAEVLVERADGGRLHHALEDVAAADEGEVRRRFVDAAQSTFGASHAADLLARIDDLESLDDASHLGDRLTCEPVS